MVFFQGRVTFRTDVKDSFFFFWNGHAIFAENGVGNGVAIILKRRDISQMRILWLKNRKINSTRIAIRNINQINLWPQQTTYATDDRLLPNWMNTLLLQAFKNDIVTNEGWPRCWDVNQLIFVLGHDCVFFLLSLKGTKLWSGQIRLAKMMCDTVSVFGWDDLRC